MIGLSLLLDVAASTLVNRCWPMGFDVGPIAPNDWRALREYNIATGTVLVWNGASEDTIYGTPSMNYASRAWHDWCHLTGPYDFSEAGEANACAVQQVMLRSFAVECGFDAETTEYACRLLDADINGQRQFKDKWDQDVRQQREFAISYLVDARQTLSTDVWAR